MQRDKETGHVSEEPVRLKYREATKNKEKKKSVTTFTEKAIKFLCPVYTVLLR